MEQSLEWATVAGIGPGLSTSPQAAGFLKELLACWKGPLVIDADGLNRLAEDKELLKNTEAKVIVTPHPGEMARLTGKSVAEILQRFSETAVEFAREYQVICVLKDARTVVTDGTQLYINSSGNPGMAGGGSGDVLTGVICGLLAQGMAPMEAACLGVYLHGAAGDRAVEKFGYYGMMSGDMAECLGDVLK